MAEVLSRTRIEVRRPEAAEEEICETVSGGTKKKPYWKGASGHSVFTIHFEGYDKKRMIGKTQYFRKAPDTAYLFP